MLLRFPLALRDQFLWYAAAVRVDAADCTLVRTEGLNSLAIHSPVLIVDERSAPPMSSLYKCEGFIVEDLSTIPDILPYVSTVVFQANSASPFNIADTIKVLSLLPSVDHLDFRNIEFDMCSDHELEELSKACQNVNMITMLSCTISTDSLNALLLYASHIWNLEFGRDMVYDLSGLSLKEHVATALGAIRAIDMVVHCGHDWYQYMWLNYVTFQSLKVIRFAMQDDEARHALELLVASSVAVE